MNSIKKQRKGRHYNKSLTKEEKILITHQLENKIKTISQIAKEYNLPRSTICSYQKSKIPMYSLFLCAVLKRAQGWVDMMFETLNNLRSKIQVKKYITMYLLKEQFFENSSKNPLFDLIPKTKLNSKKHRIFQKALKETFQYFKNKNVVKDVEFNEEYYDKDYYKESNIFEESIFISFQDNPYQNIQTECQNNTLVVEQYEPFKASDYDNQGQYFN